MEHRHSVGEDASRVRRRRFSALVGSGRESVTSVTTGVTRGLRDVRTAPHRSTRPDPSTLVTRKDVGPDGRPTRTLGAGPGEQERHVSSTYRHTNVNVWEVSVCVC